MINLNTVKSYCPEHYKEIENYEQAINDKRKTWVCHHRNGEQFSTEWLISNNMYFNRTDPHEFKFVTKSEHNKIHSKGRKHTNDAKQKIGAGNKGKTRSNEYKSNLSIQRTTSEFGKKFIEHYGITCREDHKLYDREKHWYRTHGCCRWEV